MSKIPTYIYDGIEVKRTDRIARRPSTISPGKFIEMYEIVPVDPEAIQFSKWVPAEHLYVVQTIDTKGE